MKGIVRPKNHQRHDDDRKGNRSDQSNQYSYLVFSRPNDDGQGQSRQKENGDK